MFEKCAACQGAGFTVDKSKIGWKELECSICKGKGTIMKEERKVGDFAYGFGNYGPIYCSGTRLDVSDIPLNLERVPRLTG